MKIGYIYLYGEEWEEWKKHNKPLSEIIDDLKAEGCDKIYMDVFLEDYTLTDIERLDMLDLFNRIANTPNDDELIIRGRINKNTSEIESQLQKELKRICNRHKRQI